MMKILAFILGFLLLIATANAAITGTAYPSKETVAPGETFTITVRGDGTADGEPIDNIKYNLNGDFKWCSGTTTCQKTWTFTAPQTEGTQKYDFTIYGYSTASASASVTVKKPVANTDASRPTVTMTTSNTAPKAGESFTLTIEASDNSKLASVILTNLKEGKSETLSECNGVASCKATRTFTFSTNGVYNFDALATDSNGNQASDPETVNVGGSPTGATTTAAAPSSSSSGSSGGSGGPAARAIVRITPSSPVTGEQITFDASLSVPSDSSGKIVRYEWDLNGDDVVDFDGNNAVVTYAYATANTYRVRLFVTDSFGRSNALYTYLTVKTGSASTAVQSTSGTFTISITDDDGKAVRDAKVTLTSKDSTIQTKNTDSNGIATFTVAPDCYTIASEKDGYEFKNQNYCVAANEVKAVSLEGEKSESFLKNWKVTVPIIILVIVAIAGVVLYKKNPLRSEEKS